ncbi:bifunctional diaminohydroxyphosphoribosylaminopyrimidine deaminase/5-amino-6-(5-phosphoribosylamino)uracil reductase RibD [Kangiella sp. HD9-110m-PIT-SAG06]|nr:bifunctional diaminohydroxyphosphoribosylaminopyrimidine deaminase/5-amino-6-(5-phosphoribosylamino)uracil reductase RibD [Kangiella sp. HD9-110m-PIT-SAG06]
MSFNSNDARFMARAIQLARQGWYTTRSNPRVGCVLVKTIDNDLQIIGEGWHEKPGLAHAEVNAIKAAETNGHDTNGVTAYVTLEPCSHFGKTPPCAKGLIDAGVTRVVCAMTDPNPQVAGRGFEMLRAAGIRVEFGLMEQDAKALNLGFIKRMTTGLPRVVAKTAVSVDGRTAMASGESQWITGSASRTEVQRLRAQSGAVITGSGTVLYDNPSMNVREESLVESVHFEQPLRVIIDSKHQVQAQAKIFQSDGHCWLVSASDRADIFSNAQDKSVSLHQVKQNSTGFADLESVLKELADAGINDVLIEAGSELLGAFMQQNLVDELHVFMAPKLLGSVARPMANLPFDSMKQAIELELTDVRQIGKDLKLTYNRVD